MAQDRQIAGLQYLRGYAAIGVLMTHAIGMIGLDKYFGQQMLPGMYRVGNFGVDVFFVLSGVIICVVTLTGASLTPVIGVRTFAAKRFSRIVALMWVAIVSYSALRFLARGSFEPIPFWTAMTLFPAGRAQPDVIWTLRHELVFYMVFAMAFLGPKPQRWAMVVWTLAPIGYGIAGLPAEPRSTADQIVWTLCSPFNLEFGAGVAIGIAWIKGSRRFRIVSRVSGSVVVAIACLVVAALIVLGGAIPIDHTRHFGAVLLASAPVMVAMHISAAPGWLDRPARKIGDASYSIYLFHLHFVSATLTLWRMLAPDTPAPVVFAGVTVVGLASGLAVHRWVERPLVDLIHGQMIAWRHYRLSRAEKRRLSTSGIAASKRNPPAPKSDFVVVNTTVIEHERAAAVDG